MHPNQWDQNNTKKLSRRKLTIVITVVETWKNSSILSNMTFNLANLSNLTILMNLKNLSNLSNYVLLANCAFLTSASKLVLASPVNAASITYNHNYDKLHNHKEMKLPNQSRTIIWDIPMLSPYRNIGLLLFCRLQY